MPARISRLLGRCSRIKELADAQAEECRGNAEQRGEEIYSQTVTNVEEKLQIEFAREEAEIEKTLKIREAQIKNNVKLEILKAQTEALHEALRSLCEFSDGPDYPDLLKRLIVEGLNRLRETRVRLMVRKADLPIAQRVVPEAVQIAQEQNPGFSIKVKIERAAFWHRSPAAQAASSSSHRRGRSASQMSSTTGSGSPTRECSR
jgi:V-type H+-transporting ATPase subunit E